MSQSVFPMPKLHPPQVIKLAPHQEAMVVACKAGRLADLQTLFDEHDVKAGDDPVPYSDPSPKGAPETAMLFVAAISHGHQSIVRYLHSIYPNFNFYNGRGILCVITEQLDLDMVQLLYSYSPRLISYAFNDHHRSVLRMACYGGPRYADFVHLLLDDGAVPSHEGSPLWRLGGDLTAALEGNQPTDVIKRMIPKTHYLSTPIYAALQRKRADALGLLLDEDYARRDHFDPSYGQSLLCDAKSTGDEEVIAVVERYVRNSEKRARKSAAKDIQSKTTETRKWWQLSWPAFSKGKAQPKAADISHPTDGSTKSGWPLLKGQKNLKPSDSDHEKKDLEDSDHEKKVDDSTSDGET